MKMTERNDNACLEAELDRLLAKERASAPVPDASLMARIMADARAEAPRVQPRAPGLGQRLNRALREMGGWPAVAGLAAASAGGFWIGIDPPATLFDIHAAAEPLVLVDYGDGALLASLEGGEP